MFYPCGQRAELSERQASKEWTDLFKKSLTVTVVDGFNDNSDPILRPNQYGKHLPGHAYLGSNYCPIAFYSQKPF